MRGFLHKLTFLLICSTYLTAQSTHFPMPQPARLPHITANVLPGEGWHSGEWKVLSTTIVYDGWKSNRHPIATIHAGMIVTALSGLNIVQSPDIVRAVREIPELGLVAGEEFLRYANRGEGSADVWAKGSWYPNFDASFTRELLPGGCRSRCKAHVLHTGQQDWWANIELGDGRRGWARLFNEQRDYGVVIRSRAVFAPTRNR
jgi:hypothetical protein